MGNTYYWLGYSLVLMLFDAAFTARRIKKFGVDVEQNLIIRKSVEVFEKWKGLLLSKILPTTAILVLLVKSGLHDAVVFYAGTATMVTLFQLMSLPLEDKLFAAITTNQADANRPPSPMTQKMTLFAVIKAWFINLFKGRS